ncbi:MAG TPA: sigma 54-interacting transcriptional regulator [Gemmatimonadota bacterium]|nr:sigma 54-interacting transcriptional regulator [Gemmatimonadota bacterium]
MVQQLHNDDREMMELQDPMLSETAGTQYWEVGGHPNFLLSVDERVISARERLSQVADTSLTVLLCGERGVGKEMVARGIHELSSRREKPFVTLNGYAIPRASIERELFEGGFAGKVGAAEDGTLYLHGVELLTREVRDRLVNWKRERVEGSGPEPRLILSCEQPSLDNDSLAALERAWSPAGGVVRIEIPPLRDRAEDVPLLANHILQKYGPFYGSRIRTLRSGFLRFLQSYRWPGNGRELERVIRRFLVVEDEEAIREELSSKQPSQDAPVDEMLESGTGLKDIVAREVARVESRAVSYALRRARWNKKRAAADLGVSYKTLLNKIKDHEIEV